MHGTTARRHGTEARKMEFAIFWPRRSPHDDANQIALSYRYRYRYRIDIDFGSSPCGVLHPPWRVAGTCTTPVRATLSVLGLALLSLERRITRSMGPGSPSAPNITSLNGPTTQPSTATGPILVFSRGGNSSLQAIYRSSESLSIPLDQNIRP